MITNPVFSTLFDSHLRQRQKQKRIGTIYNTYRVLISLFFTLNFYLLVRSHNISSLTILSVLPTFGYLVFSIGLVIAYYYYPRVILLFVGLIVDVMILSVALYFTGTIDLQIVLMFLVVVAASFILVSASQAALITVFAIVLVIYQQFFSALVNNQLTYSIIYNALLMSASFLAVAYLTWSVTKRLSQMEQLSERQTSEVNALNAINQQVVQIIQQGVLVVTHQLEILIINETAIEQLQLTDALSSFFLPFVHSELADSLLPIINDTQHEFIFRAYPQPQALGEKKGKEATEAKAAQSETFVPSYTDLRIRLTQLGNGYTLLLIEDLKREQSHAQQLKLASLGQLTASIAHEIRNPLATISQASQLLMEEAQDEASGLSAENLDLYDMIFKQTKRMNQIIEDVLKLSRQAKPNQTLIAPNAWLPEFIKDNFADHDIFLHCHTLMGFYFDIFQLEQVLVNLINNGLRFSSKAHPHAFVTLKVYEAGHNLHIDVLDEGTGVKPEHQQDLFNPFFTTDREGTGLGLYLSQAFCQANNANLQYIPNHDYTCFRISAEKFRVEG